MPDFATYVCAGRQASPAIDSSMQFVAWVGPGLLFIAAIWLVIEATVLVRRAIRAVRRRRDTRDGIQHIEDWINDPDNRPRKEDR